MPSASRARPEVGTAGMTLVEVTLALMIGALLLLAAGAMLAAAQGSFEVVMTRAVAPAELREFRRAMAADLHAAPCCPPVVDLSGAWQPAVGPVLPGDNLARWELADGAVSWRVRAAGPSRGSEILRAVERDGQWTWRVVLGGVEAVTTQAPVAGEPWIWWITPVGTGARSPGAPEMVVLRSLGEP